jgi:hypothetical protein
MVHAYNHTTPLSIHPMTYSQRLILLLEITLIQVCITLIILKLFGLIGWSWLEVLILPMLLIGLPLTYLLFVWIMYGGGYALICMIDPIYSYIVNRKKNRD